MEDKVLNRIGLLRKERNISRRDLATTLGVHYQTVGYLERGEYAPSLALALRIATLFQVPVEEIFTLGDDALGTGSLDANSQGQTH